MRNLILIKHSRPQVIEGVPPSQWRLSEEGQRTCRPLADAISRYAPQTIISSEEPKAVETGRMIAELLQKPFRTAPNLHEHQRDNVPQMRSHEFISSIAIFFKKRGELVLGEESADTAKSRFSAAVDQVLAEFSEGNIAIIAHGTVIALYAEESAAVDAFSLWRRMGLPSYLVLEHPSMRLIELAERIGAA